MVLQTIVSSPAYSDATRGLEKSGGCPGKGRGLKEFTVASLLGILIPVMV